VREDAVAQTPPLDGTQPDDGLDGVRCRVPVYRLHPTKTIRWKVEIRYPGTDSVVDKAPSEGMFG
jgi:hypothetical protein